MEIVQGAENIFNHSNKHMATKLRHFGSQGQLVVKYVCSRMRKYQTGFYESHKTIAENTGVSVSTVKLTMKRSAQLGIFRITNRTKETLDGKMRNTTCLVELLPYEAAEIVSKVVKKVKEVASRMVKVVTNVN